MSSSTSSVSSDDGRPSSTSSPSSKTKTQQQQVQLTIYDLSQGMAKTLSAQLLGPDHAIDVVPHTGVLVYGKEYFFGSGTGVAVESPEHFRSSRGIQPLEIRNMGTTTVPQRDFDDWCRQKQATQFQGSKYNLFENNCNHFSQQALLEGLKLSGAGVGVPQWILDVPQKFLASPFGQVARPVLENMQVSGGVPFAATNNNQAGGTECNDDGDVNGKNKDNGTHESSPKTTVSNKKLHPRQATPGPAPSNVSTSGSDSATVTSSSQPSNKTRKISHQDDNNNENINSGDGNSQKSVLGNEFSAVALQALQNVMANQRNKQNTDGGSNSIPVEDIKKVLSSQLSSDNLSHRVNNDN